MLFLLLSLFFVSITSRQDARGLGSDARDPTVATTLLPFGEATFPKGVHHPPGLGQGPGQGDRLADGCALDTAHDPPHAAAAAAAAANGSNGRILAPGAFSEASFRGRSNMSTGKHTFPKVGTAVTEGSALASGRGQGMSVDCPRGGKVLSSPDRIAPPPGAVTLVTPRVKRVRLKVSGACRRQNSKDLLCTWYLFFFAMLCFDSLCSALLCLRVVVLL